MTVIRCRIPRDEVEDDEEGVDEEDDSLQLRTLEDSGDGESFLFRGGKNGKVSISVPCSSSGSGRSPARPDPTRPARKVGLGDNGPKALCAGGRES